MRNHQSKLAVLAGVSQPFISELVKGNKSAAAPLADRLAGLTGTDIRVWLRGGRADDRRKAFEAWAASEDGGQDLGRGIERLKGSVNVAS
jgi:plasmid maintenance system antidote protein VapI